MWAARADIERALDALVENALRYSPPGHDGDVVSAAGRIEVRDRGPGVGEDERELVFERFHRGGPAEPARPATARAWRSRASWCASGAARSMIATAGGGGTVAIAGAAPRHERDRGEQPAAALPRLTTRRLACVHG